MRDLRSSLILLSGGDQVLTLDDLKQNERIDQDNTDEDDYLTGLLAAAQAYLEGRDGITGRAFLTQRWQYNLESFIDPRLLMPGAMTSYSGAGGYGAFNFGLWSNTGRYLGEIRIPLPPLQSVQSVQYLDPTETLQTVDPSTYRIVRGSMWSSLITRSGWPATIAAPDAVQISFTAGYTDIDGFMAERAGLAHAMKLLCGHWYQNREGVTDGRISQPFEMPWGIDRLLAPHRLPAF